MLKVLLHIFRRKHITNADLKRALDNLNRAPVNQPKIIEYQDLPVKEQDVTNQPGCAQQAVDKEEN
jgi:hypothetical protein